MELLEATKFFWLSEDELQRKHIEELWARPNQIWKLFREHRAILHNRREYSNPDNVKRLRRHLEQRRVLQDAEEPEHWIDKKGTY